MRNIAPPQQRYWKERYAEMLERPSEKAYGDAVEDWPRLPEWNDLTNAQRKTICDEAYRWNFDECLEADAAVALYDVIRLTVLVPPPPLVAVFASALAKATPPPADGEAG